VLLTQLFVICYRNGVNPTDTPYGSTQTKMKTKVVGKLNGADNEQAAKTAQDAEKAEGIDINPGRARIIDFKDLAQTRLDQEYEEQALGQNFRMEHKMRLKQDVIQISLQLSRPMRVGAGQHIGLCIPAISRLSFLQVHPIVVASWSEGLTEQLHLMVEPRRGWTRKLLEYTKLNAEEGKTCRAFFTGPYGTSVPTQDCGIVILVASGMGIVAQLPYLRQLIHNYNACRARTRRIHFIWILKTLGMCSSTGLIGTMAQAIDLACIFEDILNEFLLGDTLDDGRVSTRVGRRVGGDLTREQILSISIFVESQASDKVVPFGKRAVAFGGLPDLEGILDSERKGNNIKRVQEEEEKKEDMLLIGKSRSQRVGQQLLIM
jgi:hypothetical protein